MEAQLGKAENKKETCEYIDEKDNIFNVEQQVSQSGFELNTKNNLGLNESNCDRVDNELFKEYIKVKDKTKLTVEDIFLHSNDESHGKPKKG